MSYSIWSRLLLEQLGIKDEKLPVEGLPAREVFGYKVWVTPQPAKMPGARFRNFSLRVMGACPACGQEMAVSRLQQHEGTAACAARAAKAAKVPRCPDCGEVADFTTCSRCSATVEPICKACHGAPFLICTDCADVEYHARQSEGH